MIRAAVVGCGFQGRLHLEALRREPDVAIVGICDTNPARLAEAGELYGVVSRLASYEQLLAAHEIDLLSVCTMPDTHERIAVDAFAAGAHVLCEKPLAMTLDEGAAMAEAARRAGRFLTVGFNMRYSDCATHVRRLIGEGLLGDPVCARAFMLEEDVPWWGRHYARDISGGGALASTAVHVLDLVLWLAGMPRPLTASGSMTTVYPSKRAAGTPSERAAGEYTAEDLFTGHVRCAGGFWLTVEGTWVWDVPGGSAGFDLIGRSGQARFDPPGFFVERDGRIVDLMDGVATVDDFPATVAREVASVVRAVREGGEPLVRADEALVVQAVTDALYRSAVAGREVEVSLAGQGGPR